jgi:predicted ribonuclease YlaK
MAVDSILHNQITALRGRAGSGKSLIALSTAWYLVEKEGYKLVIFVNPVPSLNAQELGFYKGDKLEKLLQSSVGTMLKAKFGDETGIIRAIQDNMLDILPFVDLRGFDTGDKTIAWILEAQNLTAELMKLGLQRVGEGSKVIVDGDYHQQIDKDIYVSDNGMKRMSEVFRGTEFYGEVELQNVHRSRIAELADKM